MVKVEIVGHELPPTVTKYVDYTLICKVESAELRTTFRVSNSSASFLFEPSTGLFLCFDMYSPPASWRLVEDVTRPDKYVAGALRVVEEVDSNGIGSPRQDWQPHVFVARRQGAICICDGVMTKKEMVRFGTSVFAALDSEGRLLELRLFEVGGLERDDVQEFTEPR